MQQFAVPMSDAEAAAARAFLSLLASATRLAGVPTERVLARAGIPSEGREGPLSTRFSSDRVRRAFVALDELAQLPLLGLTMATRLEPGSCLLDELVKDAATLREACEHTCRHSPLLARAGRMWLTESGDQALLCHHAEGAPALVSQLLVGGIVSRARALTDGRVHLRAVGFMQAARAPEEDYARLLGGLKVSFSQVCDHVMFDRDGLDLPILRGEPRLTRTFERKASATLPCTAPVSARRDDALRAAALELVLSGHASLERLAERLGTTTRTLQRRLAETGLSHRRLLDAVRSDLVESALSRGDGNLSSLARTLGYATPGSLRRARERWRERAAEH